MTTRLVQLGPDRHESGTAALQIHSLAAADWSDLGMLHIAIVQPGQTERFLDPRNPSDPWTTSVFYFQPKLCRREGTALWLELDHGVTFHLRANQPYRLRVRSAQFGELEEVFTGPASMRRPSRPPTGWTPPPEPLGPLTVAPVPRRPESAPPPPVVLAEVAGIAALQAPAATPVPLLVPAAKPVLSAEPDAAQSAESNVEPDATVAVARPRTRLSKWLLPIVVLTAGSVGVWWQWGRAGHDPDAITSLDACRQFVRSNPEAGVAWRKAEVLIKDARLPDCQLLILLDAAEKGDIPSARTLGGFYDPDTWSKDRSPLPAPDAEQAARWHKQAADGGEAESQYRYGMLLKLGRTKEPDAVTLAQQYLEKAASAGHVLAKAELK